MTLTKEPKQRGEILHFLKEYCVAPIYVGGPAPSSRALADVVTDAAGVADAAVVAEFGPGTGVFTEMIQKKLPENAHFFAIEIREDFVKLTQQRCPGVQVFHDSAANAPKYLEELGLPRCDCIISGLPFAIFKDELQDELLDAAIAALRAGGVFVTFTYRQSPYLPGGRKLKQKLEQRFSNIERTRTVWKNFLPAFAYRAVK